MTETNQLWSDAAGWTYPQYYSTIQCADIDGDGRAELLARSVSGMLLAKQDIAHGQWSILPAGPAWSDAGTWNRPEYYSTIQCADLGGDGQAELLARSAAGIVAFHCDKNTYQWTALPAGPAWSDAENWKQPEYYSTIQCADIDGYGQAELVARSASGMIAQRYGNSSFVNRWSSVLAQCDADPVYKQGLLAQPISTLASAGIVIPPDMQQATVALLHTIFAAAPSPHREPVRMATHLETRGLTTQLDNPPFISAEYDWYGLILVLSNQAVNDASNGLNLGAAIASAVAVATPTVPGAILAWLAFPELAIVAGLVSAYLWALGAGIAFFNSGHGVKLVIPWTSFVPPPLPSTMGVVIPVTIH